MSIRTAFAVLLPVLLLPACGGTSTVGRSVFHFDSDGETYEVVSLSLASGEGVNYLLHRDGDRVVLRARDEDQDGHIDQVLIGSLNLREADSLYGVGIAEAKRRGQYASREPARAYVVTLPEGIFCIRSILLDPGRWYNAFTVSNVDGSDEVFLLDTNADGVLDDTELDPVTMQRLQKQYRSILDEGLLQGRIERSTSGYLVL